MSGEAVRLSDGLGVVAVVEPFDLGDQAIAVYVLDAVSVRAAVNLAWSALDAADDDETLESLGGTEDDRVLAMSLLRAMMPDA